MRGQFLEHIKSWHIDAILGCQSHHWSIGGFVPVCLCAWGSDMLWSCNVLGSHAWPISRTCQIVAHWCIITARSCTSRQMDPIERKPFLGIHFIVYVFGASMCDVFTFEHVIVLSGVSQMDRMKWKLTTFGGQKRVASGTKIGHEKANDQRNRERINLWRSCVIVMWMSIVYQNSQETMV